MSEIIQKIDREHRFLVNKFYYKYTFNGQRFVRVLTGVFWTCILVIWGITSIWFGLSWFIPFFLFAFLMDLAIHGVFGKRRSLVSAWEKTLKQGHEVRTVRWVIGNGKVILRDESNGIEHELLEDKIEGVRNFEGRQIIEWRMIDNEGLRLFVVPEGLCAKVTFCELPLEED